MKHLVPGEVSTSLERDLPVTYTAQKTTTHQVTTILATSKNVLFPGHNHLLTTSTDDLTLWLSPERQRSSDLQQKFTYEDGDREIVIPLALLMTFIQWNWKKTLEFTLLVAIAFY